MPILILSSVIFSSCAKETVYKRTDAAMGTIWDIEIVSTDRKNADKASDEVFDEVKRLDRMLSLHNKESELSALNAKAGTGPVKVSADIINVLKVAVKASELTKGGFDVSIGPVVKLWGFAGGAEHIPSDAEIKAAHELVGYKMISFDESRSEVMLAKKGMVLDFGGIGKGYAVDRAASILKKYGIKNVMFSAGGQIYITGHNPKGNNWKVGIRHPRGEGLLTSLEDTDRCIATSGDYEHYFVRKNKLYHHIFNPQNSKPASDAVTCTVLLKTNTFDMPNTWADALSKIGFVMHPGEAVAVINGIKGAECVIVSDSPEGLKTVVSDNLKGKLKFNE